MFRKFLPSIAAILLLAGCIPVGEIQVGVFEPTETPGQAPVVVTATAPSTAEPQSPTETQAPTPAPTEPAVIATQPSSNQGQQEAILILQPGPGSRVTSPLHVAGEADSTFEQALVVRLVLDDGTVIALEPVTIQSELGQRGPFETDIYFSIAGERQAFLQVFSTSARDGGVTHLSTVGVTLAESGAVDIRPVTDTAERIRIDSHTPGAEISSGIVHIEGFALASFEQTLVVEILDVDGNVIAFQPVLVQAPDWGIPGPFSADIPLEILAAGPGRIVVRDPSPAYDGDIHLASVEVSLVP